LSEEQSVVDLQGQLALSPMEEGAQSGQLLLVIGAGPKAIAIAAKRAVLAKLGRPVPRVVIVDYQGVAAHWSGSAGFTDGRQLLGTRPEKDIGFPYASTLWGCIPLNKAIDKEMYLLSWYTYLIDQGTYSDWVDRGRTRPTHGEWSRYIQWVAARIEIDIRIAKVQAISTIMDGTRWQLSCVGGEGQSYLLEGDGLVLTGPGTPLTIPGQPASHPRVWDGANFWLHLAELSRQRDTTTEPLNIGVIGTGETAAAIVVALSNTLQEAAFIEVISPYGVLYSRDEGFAENRLFSDPDGRLANLHGNHRHELNWLSLSENDRREFVRRTDRGVFSMHAVEELNLAENVRSVLGTARSLQASAEKVRVEMEYGGNIEQDEYDYVIVARGFNALWFTALLDAATHARLGNATAAFDRNMLECAIGEDLSIQGFQPRLHLPMLAGVAQGPGFPNLSCLGLLSDRILSSYVAAK